MSIRTQLILLKAIMALCCIVAVMLGSRHLLSSKIQTLQATTVKDESVEMLHLLHRELEALHELNLDWSQWTPLYEFVETLDQEFVEENLSFTTLEGIRCNLVFFYNSSGELVWGKVYDLAAEQEIDRSAFDEILRAADVIYRKAEHPEQKIAADFITVNNRPMLVSVRLILDTEAELPSRGTLVMGRIVDHSICESIEEFVGSSFSIRTFDDPGSDAPFPSNLAENTYAIQVIDNGSERFPGEFVWEARIRLKSGIDGSEAMVATSGEAQIIAETRGWVLFTVLSLVGFFILILGVSYIGVDRIIVHKLLMFDRAISLLKKGGDRSNRPVPEGNDEVARLIGNFNELIEQQDEMTARLQANELQLHVIAREAMVAAEAKSSFLANMSHEIRTPMNAIIGFSDILKEESLPDEQKKYVETIHASGVHLLDLINDVLDYSKIEAGKITLTLGRYDLREVMGYLESVCRPQAEEKKLTFSLDVDDSAPETLHTDRKRFLQCLINLVSNAVKYTPEGSVNVRIRREADQKRILVCEVEDTGIGIPKEKHELIFNAFEQSDHPEQKSIEGTGLGLAITRSLAKKLGGDVSFDSLPGRGTTFTLRIKTELDTGKQLQQKALDQAVPQKPLEMVLRKGLHILAADDCPTNRALIKAVFRKTDVELDLVENGVQAIDACQNTKYDLVLMDMFMPEMTGTRATRILREKNYTVPIIALTAAASDQDRQKCLDSGCDDFLAKPFTIDQITHMLEKYCGVEQTQSD